MDTHIMLDLETLGTKAGSAIASIGAAAFNKEKILECLHIRIDLDSSLDADMLIDAKAIRWWLSQSKEAQEELKGKTPVIEALDKFTKFCHDAAQPGFKVWGNSASFDCMILRTAYEIFQKEPPWSWWNDRCYRTVKNLYPKLNIPFVGEEHKSVDDAMNQASYLIELSNKNGFDIDA